MSSATRNSSGTTRERSPIASANRAGSAATARSSRCGRARACGGLRYPTLADKRATFMGMDVSVKEGGRQIEYEDEDPRIRRIYEDELRKRGIPSRMDAVFQPA